MAIQNNISPSDHYFTGEDKTLPFTIYQADGVTPQDITGWNFSWMVKQKRTDADASAKVTRTTGSGITETVAANGTGLITVTDENIAALSSNVLYFHELKRTDVGAETVLIYGTFRLKQAVHQ